MAYNPANDYKIENFNASPHVIEGATTTTAGVLTAADKVKINSAVVAQHKTAVFNGTQDFVNITWDTVYTTFCLAVAVADIGGTFVSVNLTKIGDETSLPTNTGVRVVPSSQFTGTVYVTCFKLS